MRTSATRARGATSLRGPISLLTLLALLAGCDGGTEDPDAGARVDGGGGLDAARPDTGAPTPDGGGGEMDAATEVDAGPEPCESPGAVETVSCGRCGTTERFCTVDRTWAYGLCEGEGECAPGATRGEEVCGNCGTQQEICNTSCAWEASGTCADEGECTPGTRTRSGTGCPSGQTREVLCDEACGYQPAGECQPDACDTPGATEEVACGRCGTTERFCTAGRAWAYGICEGEGVCSPGTTDEEACGDCGTQALRCTTACAWEAFGVCEDEGLCTPGETDRTDAGCPLGQSRELTCSAACVFEPGACMIDECEPGAMETIPCGMCGQRLRTCGSDRLWTEGLCEDEGECMPGASSTEACGRCGEQELRCDVACTWQPFGTCGDEGVCAPGAVSGCATGCGTTGSQTCTETCSLGACTPPAEICNGTDEDCDSTVDEGCVGCGACPGSTAVTGTGGRYLVTLGAHSRTGSCGGSGSEALLSLSLTQTSDVFISTHHAALDTAVYVRNCSCGGAERACNDDADGLTTSVLRLTSLPAGQYTIVVDTEGASTATIPVDVYVSAPGIAGDRCGNPTQLPAGTLSLAGDTCTFANDADIVVTSSGCGLGQGGDGPEGVYYFHVPTRREITISACGAGNAYDTTLYLRAACNGTLLANQLACDDDGCEGLTTCEDFRSTLTTTLDPGLYYLFVDGYVLGGTMPTCAACGAFDLAITGL